MLVFALFASSAHAFSVGDSVVTALSGAGEVILNMLASVIYALSSVVGTILLKLIEIILIPVVSYSNFIDHPVVTNGWSVVRDLMNTGFIALMLVIAFGTMFGISRVNWTQQIPRLAIAAIAINFSRLITGLFIDFGQVIMIGFVNAIAQVGAGNFLQLLKLQQINTAEAGESAINGLSNFGSSIMSLIMVCIMLVVVLTILAVLVYRVVVLWVLIVMSPAAFLAGAAQGILSKAGDMYGQWWGKLTAAVMIGPILTFFLWLSLASVDGLTTGFNTNSNPSAEGSPITNEVATTDNLTGFIIGIALLLAGLEIAQSTAGQLGGFAASAVGAGLGVSKKMAAAPIALGIGAAAALGRKGVSSVRSVASDVGGGAASVYRGRTQESRQNARNRERELAESRIAKGGLSGIYGRRQLAKVAEEEGKEKAIQGELAKKYSGWGSTLGEQQKRDFINKNTGKGASEEQRAQAMSLAGEMVGDEKGFADYMRDNPAEAGKLLASVQSHQTLTGDQAGQDKVAKMLEKNPQWANADAESMESALTSMTSDQRSNINKRAWGDSTFREAARKSGVFNDMFSDKPEDRRDARKGFNSQFIEAAGKHITDKEWDVGDPSTGRPADPRIAEVADRATRDQAEQTRYQNELDAQRSLDMSQQANKDKAKNNEAKHRLVNANISSTMGPNMASATTKLQDIDYASASATEKVALQEAIKHAMTKGGSAEMVQSLKHAQAKGSGTEKVRAGEMLKVVKTAVQEMDASLVGGTVNKAARVATADVAGALLPANRNWNIDQAFDYSVGASEFNGGTGTTAGNANERKFAAGLAETPTMILNLDAEMKKPDSAMARVAAESVTKKQLDSMVAQWQKSRGSEMEAVHKKAVESYGRLLKQHHNKINESGSRVPETVRTQVDDTLRHFNRRVNIQINPGVV